METIDRTALRVSEIQIAHELDQGIQSGDTIKWGAFGKRTQYETLNRTSIFFEGEEVHTPRSKFEKVFTLFGPYMAQAKYVLECVSIANEKNQSQKKLYLLRSLSNIPFKINGSYCFSALIRREDQINFGLNFLKIFPENKNFLSDLTRTIKIPSAIYDSNINILIIGETGTGKTHLAQEIYTMSGRQGKFVHLNLASLSEGIIESELFGHVRGAFTGAVQNKMGALMEAQNGILFLDEIDSLPKALQLKLLLFFDNQKIRPVGAEGERQCQTRVILASGKTLNELKQSCDIRKDFYYRIQSSFHIKLVPLREHPQLIEEICARFEAEQGVVVGPRLLNYYKSLYWPGNIRELKGHLQKKKILTQGQRFHYDQLDEDLLESQGPIRSSIHRNSETQNYHLTLKEMKKIYAQKILHFYEGDFKSAAKHLGIQKQSLLSLLKNNIVS